MRKPVHSKSSSAARHTQETRPEKLSFGKSRGRSGAAGIDSVVYIENYECVGAGLFTAGVDLWLNTPHRPFEASGTSGMKAALNGVPSLSVRDGWWAEGHFEGTTGWSIGYEEDPERHDIEVASLYDKLERVILPMYYSQPLMYAQVMRSAIALNGSFFNTQRMLSQYVSNAYYPRTEIPSENPAASCRENRGRTREDFLTKRDHFRRRHEPARHRSSRRVRRRRITTPYPSSYSSV